MINIILCGGSGTRLWPLSRRLMPKQFIKLFDDKSLFQLTTQRNSKICNKQIIVANQDLYFLAEDQLEESSITNNEFILEPVGRNTAPAIAISCFALNPEEVVLITPSDHLIKDFKSYDNAVKNAEELAQNNNLVTFGIQPKNANTGFGYIEANGENVVSFHEKPNLQTAEKYIKQGNYYWNSGMFCFKAGVFLRELKQHSPEIYNASKVAFENSKKSGNISRINLNDMLGIVDDSIDYAVMEKSNKVKVVPMDANWSDVGSFDVLADELPNDENNNLIVSKKTVKTLGVKDSIIVDTGDVLLVANKENSQDVKNIVASLKKQKSSLVDIGITGYRPWGSYTILDESNGYKVKRIEVKPHKRLSLQSHKYRNEHWIVISGEAEVVNNDKTFILGENQSTYIQSGHKHRLSNKTNKALIIIEAQVGSYTGEDDIKRFDDDFNRNNL
jgi:mannose-1-phosphate guanylyltransferase